MTRDLPADLLAAVSTPGNVTGIIALLAEFRFDPQTLGMWTGIGPLQYGGVTYVGGGNLVGVSQYEESQDLQAKGLNFTLSGVPLNTVEIALNENYQSRPCKMYLALVDVESRLALTGEEGHITLTSGDTIKLTSVVNSVYPLFSGIMDVMDIIEDPQTGTITVSAENVLALLKRTKIRRYTDQDQQSRFPGDTGLSRIASLQDKQLVW